MQNFYNLIFDSWVVTDYMGGADFSIRIFDEEGKEITYTATQHHDANFTMTLSAYQAKASQLNLPKHMYEHLFASSANEWTLCGPTGVEVICRIIKRQKGRRYAKFGARWKLFCDTHSLKHSDQYLFSFNSEKPNFCFVHIIKN